MARSSASAKPCSSVPSVSPSVSPLSSSLPRGRLERGGLVGARRLERLEDVLLLGADLRADLLDRRLAMEVERELRDRAVDLQRELLQVARHAHRPRAVAEVALDLPEDGRHRIARERDLALEVEAVDRLDQAQARDLEEVVEGLLGALVAARELARERQEALDEHLAVDRVALVQITREERAILLGPVDDAPGLVLPSFGHGHADGHSGRVDGGTEVAAKGMALGLEYERRGAGAQCRVVAGDRPRPATALYSAGVR